MALELRNLSVVSYTNGFTLWHYRSFRDRIEKIAGLGYFNDANSHDPPLASMSWDSTQRIKQGDMILAVGVGGAQLLFVSAAYPQLVQTTRMVE